MEHMAEHMRVSLIDPKWREQRESMLAKIRETTKASDDEIGQNLLGLAKHRPDVFGTLPTCCESTIVLGIFVAYSLAASNLGRMEALDFRLSRGLKSAGLQIMSLQEGPGVR